MGILACRLVDLHNLDLGALIPKKHHVRLYKQLGWLHLLNFLKVDGMHFELRLDIFEERTVCQMLCLINKAEFGLGETRLNREPFLVPAVWGDRPAQEGLFEVSYQVDPRNRQPG